MLPGTVFNRWTLTEQWEVQGPNRKNRRRMFWCICSCGTEKWVAGVSLRNGDSKSCGCMMSEAMTARMKGNTNRVKAYSPIAPMPAHLLPPPIPPACQLTRCLFGAAA